MKFDPDAYLSQKPEEAFDPDAYLGTKEVPGMGEAAARGATQGATLGFADELSGALGAVGEKVGGLFNDNLGKKSFGDTYREYRDAYRGENAAAQNANPVTFGASSMAGSVLPAAVTGPGVGALTAMGAAQGVGDSTSDSILGTAKDAAIGGGIGYAAGKLAQAVPSVSKYISDKLGSKAEALAENATGATRVQSETFAPGAGRELLDRGIVRFGETPANVASRAEDAMKVAESSLDDILRQADAKGTISPDDIMAGIDDRIAMLRTNPSTVPQAKALESIKLDITEAMGDEAQLPSVIEQWKRSFGKNTNWNDPEKTLARKEAYGTLQGAVESSVGDAALGPEFQEAKKTWGLLKPIREASEKRAAQLQQHPIAGLNDLAAAGAGALAGDPSMGVATAIARRAIAPRISSSAAVTADVASKGIGKIPKLMNSKYGPMLQAAAARGGSSLATTQFLLQQQDPEYQQLMKEINEQ